MTKNNLREHLNWLLHSESAPPAPPSRPAAHLQLTESGSILDNEAGILSSAGPLGLTLRTANDANSVRGTRPQLPLSIAESNDAMARLQLPAKSNTKPRLLSENVPLSLQTPQPAHRTSGLSLKDQYKARYDRKTEGGSSDSVSLM